MYGYIKKFRDENTLVLHGGDDFQGSPISTITRGNSQIELLNLFNIDAFVVGNHEFDYGQFSLDSALMKANFDYLSGNLYFKTKKSTFGKNIKIKTINGIKIGIIGVSPPDLLTLTIPKNTNEITMLDMDSVISAGIKILKSEKCNLIVVLSHCGVDYDKKIAEKFYGDLDVIIGGHSHTPLYKPVIVNGVLICQAGSYGKFLGKFDIKVDIKKDTVVKYYEKLVETVFDSTVYDKSVQEKVDGMLSSIQGEMGRVIGKLETDWKRSYSKESNMGQWEADAIRQKIKTDITFLNSGGLRKDLPKGNITVGDIWEISPFGNTIIKFSVSGKTLKEMIKNNLLIRDKELKEGGADMIIASGIEIVYDSKKIDAGGDGFIVSVKINGKDLDESKQYSISTNNYLAAQFRKFFGTVNDNIKMDDTNVIDRDIFTECVTEQKVIKSVVEVRIKDLNVRKNKDDE
jgi:5''-nucleotidase/2'',3''-cyclic phosphodiesterase and related esterases